MQTNYDNRRLVSFYHSVYFCLRLKLEGSGGKEIYVVPGKILYGRPRQVFQNI